MADGTFFMPASAGAGIPFELSQASQVTVKFLSTAPAKVSVRYL
jgi:hypothetical protein